MTLVQNPILPGCYPDPSICRVGEDYFLVTSTFEYLPGLPVFHSRDLAHWEPYGYVIDRPGMFDMEGLESSSGLYAPTIRHHDGLFWVVCTLVDQQDPGRGGNFVVTATDPAGPWSDPVWLDVDGIDPSIFFDDDGRIWMHGTRLADPGEWHHQTEVWLREFDPIAMRLVGKEHILWTGALRGAVWAEGPHISRVDGQYYLLVAEGGTDIHHAVCVARAEAVTGPYEGHRSNPVLTHRHLGMTPEITGVGHADLVQAVGGTWWAVLLAMRPYGGYHYNLGRETFLVAVEWEDGWPIFAPGRGQVTAGVEVPFAGEARSVVQGTVSGEVLPDDPRWSSVRALPSEVADADASGWELPMRASTPSDPTAAAFLGIRQQHANVDFRAALSGTLADGEEYGLIVRQSERDHVRCAVRRSPTPAAQVIHRSGGVDDVIGEISLPAGNDNVTLRVAARGQDYAFFVDDASDALAIVDGRTLDAVATGGFLGLWFGVYASSNGVDSPTVVRVDRVGYVPH